MVNKSSKFSDFILLFIFGFFACLKWCFSYINKLKFKALISKLVYLSYLNKTAFKIFPSNKNHTKKNFNYSHMRHRYYSFFKVTLFKIFILQLARTISRQWTAWISLNFNIFYNKWIYVKWSKIKILQLISLLLY